VSKFRKAGAVILLIVATVLLAACPPRVKIADINRDPARYSNKDISIAGHASGSFVAFGTGLYEVDDGISSMWVYSQNFGVPEDGAKVAVTGRIQQGFSIAGHSYATILKETKRRH
jgi:hypothetical protein